MSVLPAHIFVKSTYGKKSGGENYQMNYFSFPQDFDKFMSSKKEKFDYSENYQNFSKVEALDPSNFKARLLDDKSFRECLLEISKDGCPACFQLGKTVDHISQKFWKARLEYLMSKNKSKIDKIKPQSYIEYPISEPVYSADGCGLLKVR